MPDPIHQFEIHRIIPINIFGWDVSFTNSSMFLLVAVLLTALFFYAAMRSRSLVPTRLQSVAEIAVEFVRNMLRESMGEDGMQFFPFVFSLFIFIFVANMLAGHITLKVFGGFVVMLLGAGIYSTLAPLPLVMTIAITALEVLVAFLQAYVFAMLTCIYLGEALHPEH